jgi:hypothetical protein
VLEVVVVVVDVVVVVVDEVVDVDEVVVVLVVVIVQLPGSEAIIVVSPSPLLSTSNSACGGPNTEPPYVA